MTPEPNDAERLRGHAALASVAEAEIEWLLANGELMRVEAGESLARQGEPVDFLYLVLKGHVAIYFDRGAGKNKVMEWRTGDVTGVLPYSRLKTAPGDTRAEVDTEVWAVGRELLGELARECPEFTAKCVHIMTDRARHFRSTDLQDEKTLALGKLAAGLAHELNNPASAMVRSAKALTERLTELESALLSLARRGPIEETLTILDEVREACLTVQKPPLDPLQRADREDDLDDWIASRGGDPATVWPLIDSSVTLEQLERLSRALGSSDALNDALRWMTSAHAARDLVTEIERGASRVSDMVSAVKSFTHMDRATVDLPVDVAKGLHDAVTVLHAKAVAKRAQVRVDIDGELPPVLGIGGELNQIWASLIDNAIDAVPEGGGVDVAARRAGARVMVEIVDDGPGIPAEIRSRIFDPFFTTKGVGEGTGLGLDVARRLVGRYEGTIEVESRSGRTVFRVQLPAIPTGAPSEPT